MAVTSIKSNQTQVVRSPKGSHWLSLNSAGLSTSLRAWLVESPKSSGYLFSRFAALAQAVEVVAHSGAPCSKVTIYQELLPGGI